MYDHDAADIFNFQRYSYRYDHLRAYEYDLWKIQEIDACNLHTCSSVYLEIYFNITRSNRIFYKTNPRHSCRGYLVFELEKSVKN